MQMNSQIVIGGGSWGMGIAAALAAANQDVGLLVRNQQTVQLLAKANADSCQTNPLLRHLPRPSIQPVCAWQT